MFSSKYTINLNDRGVDVEFTNYKPTTKPEYTIFQHAVYFAYKQLIKSGVSEDIINRMLVDITTRFHEDDIDDTDYYDMRFRFLTEHDNNPCDFDVHVFEFEAGIIDGGLDKWLRGPNPDYISDEVTPNEPAKLNMLLIY